VPIAEPGFDVAQRLQQRLRERIPDVRWARPETLHLTVHFFGQVEDERAAAAVELVAPVALHTPPFTVVLDRLGSFPPHGVPRVLWLGPSGDVAPLNALALECRTVLRTAGFEVDQRAYNPHCTLGRPRMRWSAAARSAWAAARQEQPDVRFATSRLVLYESCSAPGGAVYTERASLKFARLSCGQR
jgi:RNA 2',3'-cyclic 3'-phosphodiesterase